MLLIIHLKSIIVIEGNKLINILITVVDPSSRILWIQFWTFFFSLIVPQVAA